MEIQLGIPTDEKLPEHPFWNFSLQLYQNNDVSRALLFLQNAYDFNVNLVLYFCWHAFNGQGALNQARIHELLLHIRPWHERIVLPLRRIRDRLKPYAEKLLWAKEIRQMVFLEELQAEHAEQLMIAERFVFDPDLDRTESQKCADICRSLTALCRVLRTHLDHKACDAVAVILSIMYSQIPLTELAKLCRKRLLQRREAGTQLWIDI